MKFFKEDSKHFLSKPSNTQSHTHSYKYFQYQSILSNIHTHTIRGNCILPKDTLTCWPEEMGNHQPTNWYLSHSEVFCIKVCINAVYSWYCMTCESLNNDFSTRVYSTQIKYTASSASNTRIWLYFFITDTRNVICKLLLNEYNVDFIIILLHFDYLHI